MNIHTIMSKGQLYDSKKLARLIESHFKSIKLFVIFLLLLSVLIFTRFSFLETKSSFGWDQVDNAWAVKDIVVDGKLPLVGMQAKGNTGFFIGPYYYYFLVPFYVLTGMDPVASGIAAGVTAVLTFFVIYYVTRSIFNEKVALFALLINTFSIYILDLDRVQWPVNFIVPLSFLFLYSLYKICLRDYKFTLLLSIVLGFSLHIHFTSIFYFVFLIFVLPFMRFEKKALKFLLWSLPILLFFSFPILFNYFVSTTGENVANYIESTFHGFHMRRFIQIIGDGFIEFNALLNIPYSLFISLLSFVLYLFLLVKKRDRKSIILAYFSLIWVLVPWIAFSTYSGEITNYYFGITRPIAIIVLAYLLYRLFSLRNLIFRFVVLITILFYGFINVKFFYERSATGLNSYRQSVLEKISRGERVEFNQGDPQSYLYYYYTEIGDEQN